MACFLVSAAEAVVVTAIEKVQEKKEEAAISAGKHEENSISLPLSRKLGWLKNMLAGGSVMLAFEHIWHGEVVPYFPFLTAMYDPGDTAEMLSEMSTVGVSMAALITLVWAGMCVVADMKVKKEASSESARP